MTFQHDPGRILAGEELERAKREATHISKIRRGLSCDSTQLTAEMEYIRRGRLEDIDGITTKGRF